MALYFVNIISQEMSVNLIRRYDDDAFVTYCELTQIALRTDYEYIDLVLALKSVGYELSEDMPADFDFRLTVVCSKKEISLFDVKKDAFTINPAEMVSDICAPEDFESDNPSGDIFNDEDDEDDDREDYEGENNQPEIPRYDIHNDPRVGGMEVDMDNPAPLSDEQRAHGRKIFDVIDAFIKENPDVEMFPMICISQNWDVALSYSAILMDSDFVTTPLYFLQRDEAGGLVADLAYIEQCVPYVEEMLARFALHCYELYGDVPDLNETIENDNRRYCFEIVATVNAILTHPDQKLFVTFDNFEMAVYPGEEAAPYSECVLVQYPAANFLKKANLPEIEFDLDKVKDFAQKMSTQNVPFIADIADSDNTDMHNNNPDDPANDLPY